MALQYTPGSIVSDGAVVITGPIQGSVTTADGTTYDVSGPAVEVDPAHKDEVAYLIGERYATEGHPAHDDETPFVNDATPPAQEG